MMTVITKRLLCVVLLRRSLQAERAEKERRQQEKREAHLYCNVRVVTDADMAEQVRRQRRCVHSN